MPQTELERLSELIQKLRRKMGNVSEIELTLDQAVDAIKSALREYSKYKPVYVLDFVTSVANQALYDLSTKERIVGIKDVYWNRGTDVLSDEFSIQLGMFGRIEDISLFENPSIWLQFMQRLESFKALFDGDFEYDPSAKMLRLIPPPTDVGKKIYYVWRQRQNVLTLPEDDEDTFLLWARAEAKETLSEKTASTVQSVSGYGESVTIKSNSGELLKEAEDLRLRFTNKLGGRSVFVVG